MPKLLLLSLSSNPDSVSRMAANALLVRLVDLPMVEVINEDARSLPPLWVDRPSLSALPTPYRALRQDVKESDGVVFFVPVHNYGANGVSKIVTEVIGETLYRKPVGIISSASSARSYLAMQDMLAGLLFEFEAIIYPKMIQVTREMFSRAMIPGNQLSLALDIYAKEFVRFVQCLRLFTLDFKKKL